MDLFMFAAIITYLIVRSHKKWKDEQRSRRWRQERMTKQAEARLEDFKHLLPKAKQAELKNYINNPCNHDDIYRELDDILSFAFGDDYKSTFILTDGNEAACDEQKYGANYWACQLLTARRYGRFTGEAYYYGFPRFNGYDYWAIAALVFKLEEELHYHGTMINIIVPFSISHYLKGGRSVPFFKDANEYRLDLSNVSKLMKSDQWKKELQRHRELLNLQ